ncbi:serine O-acetyltransferase [Neobacillus sp. NRS-1170]|uniref:serine O-acetyltransferase n=1 Tax=Neobacillus sp. NRS-1170 TaxID=3233898 RepID=UPI003D2A0A13
MYIFQDFKGINKLTLMGRLLIGTSSRAVFIFRLSSWCHQHKLKVFAKFFWYLNILLHSCDISPAADIGSNFFMYHTVGVVIGAITAGTGLRVFQNVTVGENNFSKIVPKIGNNVTLYAGSVVVGEITIGNEVMVGANSVVLKNLPNNCTAVGVPCRVIDNKYKQVVL